MKEIKVALIGGSGFMGRAHSLGYSLVSVLAGAELSVRKSVLVDVDAAVAARSATELGWERSSADWRAVVADPEIDVIDIVTPPGLHREIALAAIEHGKHVFCEKPITNDLAGAIEMREAAEARGTITQVGFNYRHISAISFLKGLLDEGRLGVPLQFRGEYLTDALFFIDDFGWRGSRASGGSGATGDIGSHIVDVAEYLLGPIARVCAVQRTKRRDAMDDGWHDEAERRAADRLDDAGTWIAEFENGAIGTFSIGLYSSGRKNALTFEIDASKGSVEFDWNERDKFRVSYVADPADHSGLRTVEVTGAHPDVWYPVPGLGQGYLDGTATQLRRFLTAVATGGSGSPDFADAVRVQRVIDAIDESARNGAWVEVASVSAVAG
jgi:predicted dehydrogenase